ncbi:ATP-binding cassette domain-containing protein [Brucella pituitosa]|uniref:ATP-binding cassette domain-containing protein n=1 Tax=Brucella pituitosa TaxID=571256 RepID=UPI002093C14E|nr:ATP-binding cassette domain-containing protein [Brucella pituitosa]
MEASSQNASEKRWQPHLDALDVKVKAKQRIRDLPVETQQGVEIARALVSDAKLLILDEPTAVLSPEGADKLFERVRRLKERGVTVILILHKIREVLAIADTVTVLRGGKLVDGPLPCEGINADKLAELIIGAAAAKKPQCRR